MNYEFGISNTRRHLCIHQRPRRWAGGQCHSIMGLGSNGPGRILGRNAKFAGQAGTGRAGN